MALAKFNFEYKNAWQDSIRYKTLITEFESGKEQRRSKGQPRRIFRLQFEEVTMTSSGAQDIWDFYVARKGRYESFLWDYEKADGTTEEVEVRFDIDTFERDTFMTILYEFGLPLIEVI